jgi:pyruvate kinase
MGDILVNSKAMLVDRALELAPCDAVLEPTREGATARAVARWRAPVWVVAAGGEPATMQGLTFSYGVHAVDLEEEPEDWRNNKLEPSSVIIQCLSFASLCVALREALNRALSLRAG